MTRWGVGRATVLARRFRADLGWPRLPDRVPSAYADQPNIPEVKSQLPSALADAGVTRQHE
jgi:hypothetical protein